MQLADVKKDLHLVLLILMLLLLLYASGFMRVL